MTPFSFSGILIGISSLGFGSLVFFKSTTRKLGFIWFLFSISVATWGFSCWLLPYISARGAETARTWLNGTYILGIVWEAPLFYHFISAFCGHRNTKILWANYLIGFLYCILTPSHIFISGVQWVFGSMYFVSPGMLYLPFFCWWSLMCLYSHFILLSSYRSADGRKRNQIKIFMFATVIGFTGGSMAFLPVFGFQVYPWGNFGIALYPLIMSYAILKHEWMDVRFVIRKTIVYSNLTWILTAVVLFEAVV
jgi:hypothetical protein